VWFSSLVLVHWKDGSSYKIGKKEDEKNYLKDCCGDGCEFPRSMYFSLI
jgi:hypothetical protein